MKKIPTLFVREFDKNHNIKNTLPIVTEGMEWVIEGDGEATIKYDGACCAIINKIFYKRYDAKKGKPIPDNAIKCQDEADPITGHLPCWVPVNYNKPEDKWFVEAFKLTAKHHQVDITLNEDGTIMLTDVFEEALNNFNVTTYEAIGKHFNNNPYDLNEDFLILHGNVIVTVERSYSGIKQYLEKNQVEGLVFWKNGEPQCKIKRSDFGFSWNKKEKKEQTI